MVVTRRSSRSQAKAPIKNTVIEMHNLFEENKSIEAP